MKRGQRKLFLIKFFLIGILLLVEVSASEYNLNIITTKDIYTPEENISLEVFLQDYEKNLVYTDINIILRNLKEEIEYKTTITSNEFTELSLEKPFQGKWEIIAMAELKNDLLIESKEIYISNKSSNLSISKNSALNNSLNNSNEKKTYSPLTRTYFILEKGIPEDSSEKNCLIYSFILFIMILFILTYLKRYRIER